MSSPGCARKKVSAAKVPADLANPSPSRIILVHAFGHAELGGIEKLVEEHCQKLIESYIQWHGRGNHD
jgi:hypothetical protein